MDNQGFEAVFDRIVAWMIDNPDACRELEERLETIKTDFGDIKIVLNPFMADDTIGVSHDGKPLAVCKIDAPR